MLLSLIHILLQTAVAKGASPEEGKEMLKKLHGVGEKVASCIQLFGLHQLSLLPIDTFFRISSDFSF